MKETIKSSRSSVCDIKERLNLVITEDLFPRLGVSSQHEVNSKYSKLSDWISRPITTKSVETTEEESTNAMITS